MSRALTFTYRNWQGEVSQRTVLPVNIWFGITEWHSEPQWLLHAMDMDKDEWRDFALQDCQFADLADAIRAAAAKAREDGK